MLWGPGQGPAILGAGLYLVAVTARPTAGLAGVVASLPLYLLPHQLGGLAASLTEAALLLGAVGVGLRALWDRARGTRRSAVGSAEPYDAPIAIFLVAALLSLLVTEYPRLSLRELRTLIVEPVLFFYLTRAVARTTDEAAPLLNALLLAATAAATLGIAQFFVGGAVTETQGVRRVLGTYQSPNHLGLLLGRALPFLIAGAWLLPARRPLLGAAGAACAMALLLTFSVGAWLGTGAAILVVVAALGRRTLLPATVGAGVVGLVGLALLFGERVLGRLDPGRGTGFVRVQLWQASLGLLAEQPLLGIGLDNFLYRYPAYTPLGVVVEPNLSHPHNLILHFWLQLGLPGLAALLWLLVLFVRRAWPRTGPTVSPAERAVAVGALASMADFVVHGLVDNSYFLVDMAVVFWLTLALGGRASPGPGRRNRPTRGTPPESGAHRRVLGVTQIHRPADVPAPVVCPLGPTAGAGTSDSVCLGRRDSCRILSRRDRRPGVSSVGSRRPPHMLLDGGYA